MDRSGFEPEASCLRSRRSTADLPALQAASQLAIKNYQSYAKSGKLNRFHLHPASINGRSQLSP